MRRPPIVCLAICWSVVSMWSPAPRARAAEPLRPAAALSAPERAAVVGDAALSEGGLLVGQLCDENQRPIPNAEVVIRMGEPAVATTVTDSNGVFAVRGLRGGLYQIRTAETVRVYRLWAAGTAPPSSQARLQIIRSPRVPPGFGEGEHFAEWEAAVRGQWGPPPLLNRVVHYTREWGSNPFVVGGIVATAVAVPVALHNADDDEPPGS